MTRTDAEIKDLVDIIHGVAEFDYRNAPRTMRRIVEEIEASTRAELIVEVKAWLNELAVKDCGCGPDSDYPPGIVAEMVDERFKP